MGYKEDIKIDRFSLDTEWEQHPSKFMEWAEKSVEAQFERDKAKEQLDLIKAQIDLEIRERVTEKKLTEAAISNMVLINPKYQEASSKFREAVNDAKILDVAKDAFEHKKKALEKITDLWISGYWSDPKVTKEAKDRISSDRSYEQRMALNTNERLQRRKSVE